MAGLAPLRIRLSLDDKFTSQIGRVNKSISRVGRQAGIIGRRLAFVGTAAVAAGAAGVAKFVSFGDTVAKTADTIGIGVEALQEYRFAADRSGVSTQKIDKALGSFSKRLGEAQAGSGRLGTILERTNPELLRQLTTTDSLDEAFTLLLGELGSMEDTQARNALAAAAFTREGIAVVNMAKNGVEGFRELREEARELGFVISDETARRSERLTDQWTNLRTIARGLGVTVGSGILPVVEDLTGQLLAWAKENRALVKTRAEEFARRLAEGIRETVAFMRQVVPPTLRFVESIGGLRTVAIAAGVAVSAKLLVAIGGLAVNLARLAAFLPGVTKLLGGLAVGIKAVTGALLSGLLVALKVIVGIVAGLSTPVLLAVGAVAALAGVGVILYKKWQPFRELVQSIFGWISDLAKKLDDFTGGAIGAALDKLGSLFGAVKGGLSDALGGLGFGGGGARLPQLAGSGALPAAGDTGGFLAGGVPSPAPAAPASATEVARELRAFLRIEVDARGGARARVTELSSESRDFELEVDTGLAMGTP